MTNLNKKRGTDFERDFCKRANGIGFMNAERQPLSGAGPNPKWKSDATMSLLTPDKRELKFLVSCKRTMVKGQITFVVAWLTENEDFAKYMMKIPVLSFTMGGKPGQKRDFYIVIGRQDYINITGNERDIVIVPMRFRGKKQLSFTKKKLDACRYKNGQPKKIPVSSFWANERWYYVFRLEEFYDAIMVEYDEINLSNQWF